MPRPVWYRQLRWKLTFGYGLASFVGLVAAEVLVLLIWSVYVSYSRPSAVAFEIFVASMRAAMLDNLLLIPLILFLAHLFSGRITRRLDILTEAADKWAQADFSLLPTDESPDEIGILSRHLANMAEQLQALMVTRQQLAASEERNRIARDLHDTVKQQVFATQMQLNATRNLLGTAPTEAAEKLDEAIALTHRSQQDLGEVISQLRPSGLEHQTLGAVLSRYIGTSSWQAMGVHVNIRGDRDLPLDVEEALFRVAQSALSNVTIHAQASEVFVDLEVTENSIILRVADDGIGFDDAHVKPSAFGLQAMRQRMEEIGGRLEVKSELGEGTTITAGVPLRNSTS